MIEFEYEQAKDEVLARLDASNDSEEILKIIVEYIDLKKARREEVNDRSGKKD